jgi:hypothetical protein
MPAWQPIPRGDDEIADVPVGVVSQEILDIAIAGDYRRECHAAASPVVFDSALVAYFKLLRMAAQSALIGSSAANAQRS